MNVAGNLARDIPKFAHVSRIGPWAARAACAGRGPGLWFRDQHDENSYSEARTICAACPVRRQCLDWALETNTEHGVFGGLSPRERKNMRIRQRLKERAS